ncbi:molybdopterin molybdotransferase MoeA [Tenacibaculum maritimum]|uniref:molybdopterin molybdotransferase MoeA n=1 Tax=Tenacibaculum maritimum TaxID=107401 RepID=UPI0012E6173D|nr:molybdopterin molybdotransferase MoeA [Tenacibaculum maritimum]CAA0145425.1 Molybdopterin molybdenumtransferase [Tenacibaculum maritimum]CAA0145480.1 Molybdopterin molybdenumtransferase [Tenacibaculum maritimum]CAA0145945.1 Molybdopterin molybdenumtransferase [Tenacibaculum maritimum]
MISVKEAKSIVLQNSVHLETVSVPFMESLGKVLKEDIIADRDFPPFNRVAMDGIAINFDAFQNGQRSFKIEGMQPAGSKQLTMINNLHCIEVMTGAVLPANCNTVIRYEDISIANGIAQVHLEEITCFQNIHQQGKDKQKGALLIPKNSIISAAEIGVLATVGKSNVVIAATPKILIISTGDELVSVEESPENHQIRKSNVFTIAALLKQLNITTETAHIADCKEVLKNKIAQYLKQYDVLLFSGAVSKGKFDFLPDVLSELGVEKLFHKVTQRPGKPFWFGSLNSNSKENNTLVFAFPGNPISTFVNCLAYFYPWYHNSLQVKVVEETATLTNNVSFTPNLTYFLQVKLSMYSGVLMATPIKGNGSGDLASLVTGDAFIILPKTTKNEFKKGAVFPIIRYR